MVLHRHACRDGNPGKFRTYKLCRHIRFVRSTSWLVLGITIHNIQKEKGSQVASSIVGNNDIMTV